MKARGQKLPSCVTTPHYISSQCRFVLHVHYIQISHLHIQPGSTDSSMLVVSDIDDIFLPKPTDLLVNLSESRASLEALLGRIGEMFQDNTVIGSALGPALQAGFKLMVRYF